MTKEEKQLLLKDLCARLPYEVRVEVDDEFMVGIHTLRGYEFGWFCVEGYHYDIDEIKPYLRPMSSITEEEAEQFGFISEELIPEAGNEEIWNTVIDWLNKHHFDHRHLIEKKLALEAPEGMYKFE